jgi:hypothetical protein
MAFKKTQRLLSLFLINAFTGSRLKQQNKNT